VRGGWWEKGRTKKKKNKTSEEKNRRIKKATTGGGVTPTNLNVKVRPRGGSETKEGSRLGDERNQHQKEGKKRGAALIGKGLGGFQSIQRATVARL